MWGDAKTEYARYSRYVADRIRERARRPISTLLDIGCGGGKNVYTLKEYFRVTGLDLSPTMLAQARELNPGCEFIQGDMRSFQLGRTFDAILMDDAIGYMKCRADFSAAFRTAFAHLNAGGVLVVTPDVTSETFRQNSTTITPAVERTKPPHIDVVFVENWYDADPSDDRFEATILYLIRENGTLRIETDRFTLGLFPMSVWKSTLSEIGFLTDEGRYLDGENEYTVLTGLKPA